MTEGAPVRVLVVCRANRCRSPLAAAIGAQVAGTALEVRSGGLLDSGWPVPYRGIAVAAEEGLDLREHRSHRVTPADVHDAEVIIAVAGGIARELAADHAARWTRVHTFGSLWRASLTSPPESTEAAGDWLDRVGAARDPLELVELPASDDIEDPFGRSARIWRRVSRRLRDEVGRVAPLLTSG
ncbi:MAG: low molecular weight phosphatase family protein [Demequina sp.]